MARASLVHASSSQSLSGLLILNLHLTTLVYEGFHAEQRPIAFRKDKSYLDQRSHLAFGKGVRRLHLSKKPVVKKGGCDQPPTRQSESKEDRYPTTIGLRHEARRESPNKGGGDVSVGAPTDVDPQLCVGDQLNDRGRA